LGLPPGAAGQPTVLRHRPGAGLVIGLVGLVAFLASVTFLPWVSGRGEDVTFGDIREVFDQVDDLGVGVSDTTTATTLPPDLTLPPEASVPADDSLGPVVSPFDDLGTPVSPSAPIGNDEFDFMEFYAKGLWILVAVMAVLAVVFSTAFVPRSRGARAVTGFLLAGMLGLAVALADDEGSVGPRVCGALVTLLCLGAHGFALIELFGDEFAPDPAYGVWAGVGGLVAVLVGCVMGTRTERVPAHH
jgi:hypothetical protein